HRAAPQASGVWISAPPVGIVIPSRFESILARRDLDPTPLILPVERDLRALDRIHEVARPQSGGLLSFLLGPSGSGKTTAAYAAPAHIPDQLGAVAAVPHDLPLQAS